MVHDLFVQIGLWQSRRFIFLDCFHRMVTWILLLEKILGWGGCMISVNTWETSKSFWGFWRSKKTSWLWFDGYCSRFNVVADDFIFCSLFNLFLDRNKLNNIIRVLPVNLIATNTIKNIILIFRVTSFLTFFSSTICFFRFFIVLFQGIFSELKL